MKIFYILSGILKKYLFLVFVLLFLSGCARQKINKVENIQKKNEVTKLDLKDKNVLMIIAPDQFRDEELFDTKEVLESYDTNITVVSSGVKEAKGMMGAVFKVDGDISDVKVDDYDAIIFIGGFGAKTYFDDKAVINIARSSYESGKVTAAICIAPVILANAGLLDGKKATVYSEMKEGIISKGANYTGDPVTQDGRIITGNGPDAAKSFGEAIAKELSKGQ